MDFTTGQLVVIGLRLIIPLLILRKPLVGGIAAMAIDGLDVVIIELFGPGGMGDHYHNIDKVLDLYYLSLEAWIAWQWKDQAPRLISNALFSWRVIGVALFELLGERWLLFIFPNLFENWFLFCLVVARWFPDTAKSIRRWRPALTWLLILYIPKLGQEYLLHIAEAKPWSWIKGILGG